MDRDFDPNKKEIAGMSESVQLKKASKNKKVEQKAAPESKSKQVLSLTQFCLFLFL